MRTWTCVRSFCIPVKTDVNLTYGYNLIESDGWNGRWMNRKLCIMYDKSLMYGNMNGLKFKDFWHKPKFFLWETGEERDWETLGRQWSEDIKFTWCFWASDVCHKSNGGKMISYQWRRNLYATETCMLEFEMRI